MTDLKARNHLIGVAATVLLLAAGAGPAAAGAGSAGCIDDWSEATRIVREERLATVERLSAAARGVVDGAIVRTSLCRESGRYVYRLLVRNSRGDISKMTVDASAPFSGHGK